MKAFNVTKNPNDLIFVFGSNIAGRHGAGAAAFALDFKGARIGQGMGHWGLSYAIPTKDEYICTLPLHEVMQHVNIFKNYALRNRDAFNFQITRIGCGLAGYTDSQIVPLFEDLPHNCFVPPEWKEYFPKHPFWEN